MWWSGKSTEKTQNLLYMKIDQQIIKTLFTQAVFVAATPTRDMSQRHAYHCSQWARTHEATFTALSLAARKHAAEISVAATPNGFHWLI